MQDIFDFARNYTWVKSKINVIDADTINKLGVVVENIIPNKFLEGQFFKLAAERGSAWGNSNYAGYLLCYLDEKLLQESLKYARKAVELVKEIPEQKDEHKYILFQALQANNKRAEANIVLMDYLMFKDKQFASAETREEKAKYEKNINEVLLECAAIIKKFDVYFQDKQQYSVTHEHCKDFLAELSPILNCEISLEGFLLLKQQALAVKEKIDKRLQVLRAYCTTIDKNTANYAEIIANRAKLVKQQIDTVVLQLGMENGKSAPKARINTDHNLILPQDILLPIKFGSSWQVESKAIHSIDECGLNDEFEKRFGQITKFVNARKEEMLLIDEVFQSSDNKGALKLKRKRLETELGEFKNIQEQLEENYKKHLPTNRGIFRRHQTETIFFNPKRYKNPEKLIDLTKQIVDQRFRTSDANIESVNLEGKSARLLISSERLFQESVIALTGEDSPTLGIPIAKENLWSNGRGTNNFGPVEFYKIGDTILESEHRENPKRNRLGDSYLPQLASYDKEIAPFLSMLSNDDPVKEKKLAGFMIRYGQTHQPVILDELRVIYDKASAEEVNKFNQICFLILEKEQSQWHSAKQEKFHIGMSVAQARCLIMMEAGFINFKEAFKNNVLFGIYSHTGIIDSPDKVSESCSAIDNLYLSYLKSKNPQDYVNFFKKQIIEKSSRVCVLTREQAHQDMKYVYGSDCDTDNEGYDTELSMI